MEACRSFVIPSVDTISPWTTQLRDAQPENAFVAVYAHHQQRLIFIGAKHATYASSTTFRLINEAYQVFTVNTAIVEGPPYSQGANGDHLMRWIDAQQEVDGFVEGGEIVPAVRGARSHAANVFGGEPDDIDIRDRLLAQGVSAQDLLGFYTLRSIPQWIREQKIAGADDLRIAPLVDDELQHNRARLALSATILPDYVGWAQWYTRTNHKVLGATFDPEETGPLADGAYGSNKIAALISRARDGFLLNIIAEHWNARENIIVVFGASHLMILRQALDSMLGAPCYAGDDIKLAPSQCSRPK
jgi:hypothetical protein